MGETPPKWGTRFSGDVHVMEHDSRGDARRWAADACTQTGRAMRIEVDYGNGWERYATVYPDPFAVTRAGAPR